MRNHFMVQVVKDLPLGLEITRAKELVLLGESTSYILSE